MRRPVKGPVAAILAATLLLAGCNNDGPTSDGQRVANGAQAEAESIDVTLGEQPLR